MMINPFSPTLIRISSLFCPYWFQESVYLIANGVINPLTTNVHHQIKNSQCKSIDWFLYDWEHWSLMG